MGATTKTRSLAPTASLRTVDEPSWATAAYPLGAHLEDGGATFAVYSKHASRVVLELFDAKMGSDARFACEMVKNPADDSWRAKVSGAGVGTLYGFRCWGPNWPYDPAWRRGNSSAGFVTDVDSAGNRFNPNKLLFDPYARELTHDRDCPEFRVFGHDGRMYRSGEQAYPHRNPEGGTSTVPCREFDTGRFAPKGVVLKDVPFSEPRPGLPRENSIIYETHVRGLTRHPSSGRLKEILAKFPGFERVVGVADDERGTYRAAAKLAVYLKALGVNVVEFLPIHETSNDDNPVDCAGSNYWGYATFGFFAPDRRHAHDQTLGGPTREFKEMVEAFHREGIEVYLDVVYNHTGEGGNLEGSRDIVAICSYLGLDASEYYVASDGWLTSDQTGCGNQLAFPRPVTAGLVLDSVKYWTEVMGVDGFRFDLAPVLAKDTRLIEELAAYANRMQIEVIAEPWALSWQEQGRFPVGWGEWNDHFRNTVRDFVRGSGDALEFVEVISGDRGRFRSYGAQRSVNFAVAHDGFTLADLVSYDAKTNTSLSWPFGPSDGGTDDNRSSAYEQNATIRRQQLRNFWAILVISRGVPMMVAGDEFGRTQNGNNNPYGIDSVATWNNYAMIASNHPQAEPTLGGGAYHDNLGQTAGPPGKNPLFVFASYLLRLRRDADELRQRNYGEVTPQPDVTYEFFREDGHSALAGWCRCVWLRIRGAAGHADWLVLLNLHTEKVPFIIAADREWARLVDTAGWAEPFCNCWEEPEVVGGEYVVHPRSAVILRSRT